MKKQTKFDMLYESILSELNDLHELETEIEKQYKSLDEFKHFLKSIDLILEIDDDEETPNYIECKLYFIDPDNDNNLIRFEYLNQVVPSYYEQYKDLFDSLNQYAKLNIVTMDGTKDSPIIMWG
jgi:hypothetical protein